MPSLDRLLFVAVVTVSAIGCSSNADPVVLEAEDAELAGVITATTTPSYSGRGYVTGFDGPKDHITFRFDATAGVYDLQVAYSARDRKAYDLVINEIGRSDFLVSTGDQFATHAAGKVRLAEGKNVIELRRGWGFFDIDRIELVPTSITPTKPVAPQLVTAKPSEPAAALMAEMAKDYGKVTWSGVYGSRDADSVRTRTGVRPRVIGGDLMDYSPSRVKRGARPAESVETLLDRARERHVITLCWHWNAPAGIIGDDPANSGAPNAPWHRGFMADKTTFDVAAALADPRSVEYAMLLADIDAIAAQLKRFEAAGVPVLWRPLHEADGKWFWWGAKGPEAFKALWHLMFTRMTGHHGLRNLIWVYTGTANMAWYPPESEFDVIGVDAYPTDVRDPLSGVWEAIEARYAGRKMVALTEFGGVPDVPAMHALGVRFAYFNSWTGEKGPDKMSDDTLRAIYAAPHIRSLP